VHDEAGALPGRLDLACPRLLLGVEANSKTFHFGRRAESLDQRRDDRLATAGWHILYVGWYDTEDPLMVASTIALIARRRADLLGIDRANSRPNGQL